MTRSLTTLAVATFALCATINFAWPSNVEGADYELIVSGNSSNGATPYELNVRLNHDDGKYAEGDVLSLKIVSPIDGYLYVIHNDTNGNRKLLVPNKLWEDNKVRAGEETQYPSESMNFKILVQGPAFGEEVITALVTSQKLECDDGQYAKGVITNLAGKAWRIFANCVRMLQSISPVVFANRSAVVIEHGNGNVANITLPSAIVTSDRQPQTNSTAPQTVSSTNRNIAIASNVALITKPKEVRTENNKR